jgi:hypothetical protein
MPWNWENNQWLAMEGGNVTMEGEGRIWLARGLRKLRRKRKLENFSEIVGKELKEGYRAVWKEGRL